MTINRLKPLKALLGVVFFGKNITSGFYFSGELKVISKEAYDRNTSGKGLSLYLDMLLYLY